MDQLVGLTELPQRAPPSGERFVVGPVEHELERLLARAFAQTHAAWRFGAIDGFFETTVSFNGDVYELYGFVRLLMNETQAPFAATIDRTGVLMTAGLGLIDPVPLSPRNRLRILMDLPHFEPTDWRFASERLYRERSLLPFVEATSILFGSRRIAERERKPWNPSKNRSPRLRIRRKNLRSRWMPWKKRSVS